MNPTPEQRQAASESFERAWHIMRNQLSHVWAGDLKGDVIEWLELLGAKVEDGGDWIEVFYEASKGVEEVEK